MKKLLNRKGSAMILVLAALIILMMVGTVVAMLSTANIAMSRKYSDWSSEYYRLDSAAQDQLAEMDQNVLTNAENIARYYLQKNYYAYASAVDFPAGTGMPSAVTAVFSASPRLQELIYTKWSELYSDYNADPVNREDEYNTHMQEFTTNLFKVLYFSYVNGNLSGGSKDYDSGAIAAETLITNAGWFPDLEDTVATFEEYLDLMTEEPKVQVTAEETATDGKKVEAHVTIVPPSFSAVEQIRYITVKANPLYANALSVYGAISFKGNGNIGVSGDVVSNNWGHGTVNEGQNGGIQTLAGSQAKVTIKGNVYSAGDLHLFGSGSGISVQEYDASYENNLKENVLYSSGNHYYFDTSIFNDYTGGASTHFLPYAEGSGSSGIVPYYYQDFVGGNVYCTNLAIEKDTGSAALSVDGIVWTNDDIQNDGGNDANISVGGNYIGLRSYSVAGNPNASSSVINNARLSANSGITLGGDCIIPGAVYYRLDDNTYYQTAESVTARSGEFFETYLYPSSGSVVDPSSGFAVGITSYTLNGIEYQMYDRGGVTPENWGAAFKDKFSASLDSRVSLNPSQYYSLGVMVGQNKVVYGGDTSVINLTAYKTVTSSGALSRVFSMKTQDYGTDGFDFNQLINPSVGVMDAAYDFYYYPGDQTVNVSLIREGILYCAGNLTLTGSGTFKGSVVCGGNLTIQAGVNVEYDESVITRVIGLSTNPDGSYSLKSTDTETQSWSSVARRFFSPGSFTSGSSLGVEKISTLSTSAGEREDDSVQRYKVNSWKEIS